MKLFYDHQIFTMQEHGGVSRYFVELARELDSRPSVDLIVKAPLHINKYLDELNLNSAPGLRIPEFPGAGRAVRFINGLVTRSSRNELSADIIHATYYFPVRIKPGSKARVVVTVHDMIHELYPDSFLPYDRTAKLKHDAVLNADHVICVSENTKQDLIRLTGVDRDKVSVVYHGVNRLKQALANDFSPPGKPFLLYVGRRGGHKNFSTLLHAFAESSELNGLFDLVCFGGGEFTQDELTKHKQLGLKKGQVRRLGGSDSLLASLYKHASAFVYPSLYEGFGMPPLEAMSFGCPVVCSNGGSIPEVVGEAGEFFDAMKPDEIARAISRIVSNASASEKLRENGKTQLKKYSWQQCADETKGVYESLI